MNHINIFVHFQPTVGLIQVQYCIDMISSKMTLASTLLSLLVTMAGWPTRVQGDVPRCDGANPDFSNNPYCLPHDYNLDIIPPMDGPLHINVDIFVFEVNNCLTLLLIKLLFIIVNYNIFDKESINV